MVHASGDTSNARRCSCRAAIAVHPLANGVPHGRNDGLSDLWTAARRDDVGGRRVHVFAMQIKPILLPVCCPSFLKSVCLLGWGDAESIKGQDHGSNTDVRLRAF